MVLFNLIADPRSLRSISPNSAMIWRFRAISHNPDNASELAILAIGMTPVTSASGGQDISVGATIVAHRQCSS
ncbi:MAG: hypothetical protein ACLS48_01875 [[Eubacterium] siraeum]